MIRIFMLAAVYALLSKPAYAYIDAGLGSLVLQGLVAGFFSFMVMWRSWIDKVKALFRGKTSPAADGGESTKAAAEE